MKLTGHELDRLFWMALVLALILSTAGVIILGIIKHRAEEQLSQCQLDLETERVLCHPDK